MKCDRTIAMQRVAGRYYMSNEEDQKLRKELGEDSEEHLNKVIDDYEMLEKDEIIDAVVNTTSIKQGIPSLLRTIGITF